MSRGPSTPTLTVINRQRAVALDVDRVQSLGSLAVGRCRGRVGRGSQNLARLAEVEVALVSDRVIAQVHRQFMQIAGATDVITFAHGELVVSAATAKREATRVGEAVEREVLRYIVHGLLHLNGHEDAEPEEAARMWQAQEEVLDGIWPLE